MNQSVATLVESIGRRPVAVRPIAGGSICDAWRVTTDDGDYFAKTARTMAPGMFELEKAGLDWIADTGVPTPGVIAARTDALLLEWLDEAPATATSARAFGVALARLHATPAESYGCPPLDGRQPSGWIGSLPMAFGRWGSWQQFYVEARLLPTLALARKRGRLDSGSAQAVQRVCARLLAGAATDAEPTAGPSRIHGDLWSGNVLWLRSGAALIDPAAHGGHPETDLAMLQLFGAPNLREILDAYQTVTPLVQGWPDRVPLHQLFPVLVHAALFGGNYRQQVGVLARKYLRTE